MTAMQIRAENFRRMARAGVACARVPSPKPSAATLRLLRAGRAVAMSRAVGGF